MYVCTYKKLSVTDVCILHSGSVRVCPAVCDDGKGSPCKLLVPDLDPCFAIGFGFAYMGVSLNGGTPISHPKMIIFSRKTNGCLVPPFWETPHILAYICM